MKKLTRAVAAAAGVAAIALTDPMILIGNGHWAG